MQSTAVSGNRNSKQLSLYPKPACMQNSLRKWHAVYTRPNCEKKVASQLSKKKIIHYFPVNTVQREYKNKSQSVSEPLFTSMVFVYVNAIEQLEVSQASGVISFIYWLDRPAVIHDDEIDEIRKMLADFSGIQLSKTTVNTSGQVKVSIDALKIREGNVMEVGTTSVQVTLPSLGYILEADVRRNTQEISNSPAIIKMYTKLRASLLS
jgi:transcription antitermination factor NusG